MRSQQPFLVRGRFQTPHKGTKARTLTLLLFKLQGLTWLEAKQIGLVATYREFTTILHLLEMDGGFDIRITDHTKLNGTWLDVYRIVGRHRWNGQYRGLGSISDHVPTIHQ
jgi:hypothetical protein